MNQPLASVLISMEQSPTFAYRLKRKLLSGPIIGGAYRITYLCLLILICGEIKAQNDSYDIMHYKSVIVCGVFLGARKETLMKMFGKPDAIRPKANEFEGTEYYEYVYGNSLFFVSVDVFDGFRLRDEVFSVDGMNLRVGDTIDKLRQAFPILA